MSKALKIDVSSYIGEYLLMNDGTIYRGYKHKNFTKDKDLKDIIDLYVNDDVDLLSVYFIDINGRIHIEGKLGKHIIDNIKASKVINTSKYLIILSRNGNLYYVPLYRYGGTYNLIAQDISYLNEKNIINIMYYNNELFLLTLQGDIYIMSNLYDLEKEENVQSISKLNINPGKTKFSSDVYYYNNIAILLNNAYLHKNNKLYGNKYLLLTSDINISNIKLNITSSTGDTLIYYNGERIFVLNIKDDKYKFSIAVNNVVFITSIAFDNYVITSDGVCRYFFHGSLYENVNKLKSFLINGVEFYDVPLSFLDTLKYKSISNKLSGIFKSSDKSINPLYGTILTPEYFRSNLDSFKYTNEINNINTFINLPTTSISVIMNDKDILINESIIGYSTVLSDMVLSYNEDTNIIFKLNDYNSDIMINILSFYEKYKYIEIKNQLLDNDTDIFFDTSHIHNYMLYINLANYLNFGLYLYCLCGFLFRKALYMKDNDRQDLFSYKYFSLPIISISNNWIDNLLLGDILSYYIYGENKDNLREQFIKI